MVKEGYSTRFAGLRNSRRLEVHDLFEGKLRKRQKGEQWELIVAGFEVQPVITSPVVTEAAL